MSNHLYIEGKDYLSAADAAALVGFTRDYIARLCREGKLLGSRVGSSWYVEKNSLAQFKVQADYERALRKQELADLRKQEYLKKQVQASVPTDRTEEKDAVSTLATAAQTTAPIVGDVIAKPSQEQKPEPVASPIQKIVTFPIAELEKVKSKADALRVSTMDMHIARTLARGQTFPMSDAARNAAAYSVTQIPVLTHAVDMLQRSLALLLAFMLTFGTYAVVDARYQAFALSHMQSLWGEAKGIAVETPRAVVALTQPTTYTDTARVLAESTQHVGARGVAVVSDPVASLAAVSAFNLSFIDSLAARTRSFVDDAVFRIVYSGNPDILTEYVADRPRVTLSITPISRVSTESTTQPVVQTPQNTNGITNVYQQPVIERVVEREHLIGNTGITREDLQLALQQLDNKFTSSIANITASGSSAPVINYIQSGGSPSYSNTVGLTQKIDQLNGTTITNATITGGSISGVSFSTGDLSGVVAVANGGTGTSTEPSYGQLLLGQADGSYTLVATSSLGLGGSGTPGGSDGDVQFRSSGDFGGSSSFTFNSSTETLSVTGASTTNATSTNATSTNFFSTLARFTTGIISSLTATNATTTNLGITGLVSSLLTTNADGTVVATSSLGVAYGGTGITTTPSYGQLLLGQADGTYTLVATSSLGITGGSGNSFSYLFPSNATTTLLSFNGGLTSYASTTVGDGTATGGLTISGGATTTGDAYFAGNVGIGTVAPSALLEIQKNQNASTYLKVTNTDTTNTNSRARVVATAGTVTGEMQSIAGSGTFFGTESNHPMFLYTNQVTRVAIGTDGKVGIGTTSPTQTLSVQGNSYVSGTSFFGGALTATSTLTLSNYTNGALAVDSSGALYTYSTSTWSFASSTLLANSNTFSGTNTFTGNTTFTNATTTNLGITGLVSALLSTNADGTVVASSTLSQVYGGTGITSYTAGDILYANASGVLSKLPIGSAGQVLKISGGLPAWGADNTGGGGGGSGFWATTTDDLAVYPSDTSDVVIVGNSATSSTNNSILEVFGKSYFSNFLGIGTTSAWRTLSVNGSSDLGTNALAGSFTATSTTDTSTFAGGLTVSGNTTLSNYTSGALAADSSGALYTYSTSTWSFASSTLLANSNTFSGTNTFTGNTTLTNATTTNLGITGLISALLATDVNGSVYATSSLSDPYISNAITISSSGSVDGAALTDGTVTNAKLANSTISGIALGSNLANLSATDSTLTFSGSYNGSTARTVGLNLGNANSWTALQSFANASSTLFSNTGIAYFGGTATTTIDGAGNVDIAGTLTLSTTGGALATDSSGLVYTYSTSTWSFASSTLLSDSNTFSGSNTFSSLPSLPLTNGYTLRGSESGIAEATTTIFIANSRNVGIQTTNAQWPLTVVATGSQTSGTVYTNSAFLQDQSTYRGIELGYDTGGNIGVIKSASAGADSDISFWNYYNSGWSETMRITAAGGVGIGTTDPSGGLQVEGRAIYANAVQSDTVLNGALNGWQTTANLMGSDGLWGIRTAINNSINFDTYNSGSPRTALAILQGGNVGVGTTSPYANLSVFAGGNYSSQAASTLFAVGSTSAGTATSTFFSINSGGAITTALTSGAIAADSTGLLYTYSTSTWSFASSTLLANSNTFSGTNTFTGNTTLTNATTTNLGITGLISALLATDVNGSVYATSSLSDPYISNAITISSSGSVDGAALTAGSVANAALANSTVSYGGVSLSLGGSDATPAFNLADATGLPISTGVSGLGSNVATFLATPSSANLASAVTDETGSGALVFGTQPTITDGRFASSTLSSNTLITGNATSSGTFALSTITSTLLKTNSLGQFVAAVAGSDYLSSALTAIGPTGQTQTGSMITIATSTSATNGITSAITVVGSGNTLTLTPSQSGTLTVAGGGTGATTLGAGEVLVGNGTGAITSTTTANLKTTLALNNVENTALSTWAGTTNITTLGTISTGVWNGTAITDTYVSDAITISGGTIGSNSISGTLTTTGTLTIGDGGDRIDIASNTWDVTNGTITGATWNGAAISAAYLDPTLVTLDQIDTSAELAAILGDETGTAGSVVFSASPTLTGTLTAAAANFSSTLALASSSPWGLLSINPSGISGPSFVIGSSTKTDFLVTNGGYVGIGTTSPSTHLSVNGSGWFTNTGPYGYSIFGANIVNVGATVGTAQDTLVVATSTTGTNGIRAGSFGAYYNGGTSASALVQGLNAFSVLGASATGNLTITTNGGGLRNRYIVANTSTGYGVSQASAVSAGAQIGGTLASSTDLAAFHAETPTIGSGSVVTNYYGLWVRGGSVTGTLTTRYGVYIDDLTGGTTRYGVYQAGTSDLNYFGGNTGIGTTTPFRKLSITDAVSTAQQAIAYDSTRYTDLLTNSVGDFIVNPQGDDMFLNDDNLWVCTGGSCPTGTPSGTGNLVVETRLSVATSSPVAPLTIFGSGGSPSLSSDSGQVANIGISSSVQLAMGALSSSPYTFWVQTKQSTNSGNSFPLALNPLGGNVGVGTTSPAQQLSVQNNLYVGNGAATGMGQATSTFQGDIKILGKLDVGTIDPVYTIDGVKYATYGHSSIGVNEEVMTTIRITQQEGGMYVRRIAFSDLERGSDLWLFYQITDFGAEWNNLVVSLTPAFSGDVHYEKDIATNTLKIVSTKAGEVSMRLVADRYDAAKWPNLRPDQDDDFTHFELKSK